MYTFAMTLSAANACMNDRGRVMILAAFFPFACRSQMWGSGSKNK